jgi:Domain of unknown function (DUF4350)
MTGRRFLIGLVAVILAVDLALWVAGKLTGATPGGPASSSYATGGDGVAAWAELLARNGHEVSRARTQPAQTALEAGSTAVVLDAQFVLERDAAAFEQFVRAGGRLIVSGDASWLDAIVGPRLSPDGPGVPRATPLAPVPEVAGVRLVSTAGDGSWTHLGPTIPILGRPGRAVVVLSRAGRGRVVLLADDSLLQNAYLGRADNARFALDIAGTSHRPVVFFESYHGYGSSSSTLGVIPARWDALLALGLLATLVYMLARGRRLGPPELEQRELAPPRREYVEAMGGILSRSRAPADALAPLRADAVARLESRDGTTPATPAAIAAAARACGLPADEADAVAREPTRSEDVLPLGRAAARLRRTSTGRAGWRV